MTTPRQLLRQVTAARPRRPGLCASATRLVARHHSIRFLMRAKGRWPTPTTAATAAGRSWARRRTSTSWQVEGPPHQPPRHTERRVRCRRVHLPATRVGRRAILVQLWDTSAPPSRLTRRVRWIELLPPGRQQQQAPTVGMVPMEAVVGRLKWHRTFRRARMGQGRRRVDVPDRVTRPLAMPARGLVARHRSARRSQPLLLWPSRPGEGARSAWVVTTAHLLLLPEHLKRGQRASIRRATRPLRSVRARMGLLTGHLQAAGEALLLGMGIMALLRPPAARSQATVLPSMLRTLDPQLLRMRHRLPQLPPEALSTAAADTDRPRVVAVAAPILQAGVRMVVATAERARTPSRVSSSRNRRAGRARSHSVNLSVFGDCHISVG